VAEIRLANGKGVALVDDEDVALLPPSTWYLHNQGYAACAKRFGHQSTLLHRIVMQAKRGDEVDHINRNKLDCRKSNLRIVTRSQNNQNRSGAMRRNRTGLRGVSFNVNPSGTVSYLARVQIRGTQHYRCGFRTAEEAAMAAVALRREHFTHSEECA
jgi:hypothetical protein